MSAADLYYTKRVFWIPNLELALGVPNNELTRAVLWAQWMWEGGNNGPTGSIWPSPKFNWLCSTTRAMGSTRFFADPDLPPVQNYPTYLSGIAATRKTFLIKDYAGYLAALRSGDPLSPKHDAGLRDGLGVWPTGRHGTTAGAAYATRVIDTARQLVAGL